MKHILLLEKTTVPEDTCIYYADHSACNAMNIRYTSDKDVYIQNLNIANCTTRNGWEFSFEPDLVKTITTGIGFNWEVILPNVTVIESGNTFAFKVDYSKAKKKSKEEITCAINKASRQIKFEFSVSKITETVTITIDINNNWDVDIVDCIVSIVDALIELDIEHEEIDNVLIRSSTPSCTINSEDEVVMTTADFVMCTTREIDTSKISIDWRYVVDADTI